jgi:predicted nucleic-acid-binding Zn-ribbon protein
MQQQNWQCPKCNNASYETDQITGTGGFFSKFFNVQNKKYVTVTCTKCRYTEMYKTDTSTLGNIFDFFGN